MYLDPGFGGMLVQVIVAIAAVGGGLLFSFRKKIKALLSKDKQDSEPMNTLVNEIDDDVIDMLDDEVK